LNEKINAIKFVMILEGSYNHESQIIKWAFFYSSQIDIRANLGWRRSDRWFERERGIDFIVNPFFVILRQWIKIF